MAHRKAGGTASNLKDSNPKFLGVKKYDGESVIAGNIIIRQRGLRYLAGKGVRAGKDYTLYATVEGKVKFSNTRKKNFDGTTSIKKKVNII